MSSVTIDITPQQKMALAGYNSRPDIFSNVNSHLEANIFFFEGIFFVSIDTLYVPECLKQDILDIVQLEEYELFIAATHTHFAPNLDKEKSVLGKFNPSYYDFTVKSISKHLIELSSQNLKYNVKFKQCKAYHSMNRRLKIDNTIQMKPNFNGLKSENINILTFEQNKEIIAIMINYACHPVTHANTMNSVSSDYIGFLRDSIRLEYGNIPILFFQGFAGDIRPNSTNKEGLKFENFSKDNLLLWQKSLSNIVLHNIPFCKSINNSITQNAISKVPYEEILTTNDYKGFLNFHKIQIGQLLLIGVSAEPMSSYEVYLKTHYKDFNVITIGCANGSFGYLPDAHALKDGGYEAKDFFSIFKINAQFNDSCIKTIKKTLIT